MTTTMRVCGAGQTVTGSCYLFETDHGAFLADCGLFQGSKTIKELNYGDFPFDARRIKFVLLTHAHTDHAGLLPKLVKAGFAGHIYATQGTVDLCSIMLPDSGHIQETEVEMLNRRNARRGKEALTPIYTAEDAEAVMPFFTSVDYKQWIEPTKGVRARFWNAGHILGSASIEIEITDASQPAPLRLLVSGDIGPDESLLQPDPEAPHGFDYVLCESTYGAVERPRMNDISRRQKMAQEVRDAAARKGALIIPSFAVERTQEVLTDLMMLARESAIPDVPIFLDSPLAIRASQIFMKHAATMDHGDKLEAALRSPNLHLSASVEDSKAIERIKGFHIIIAASGMCDAGRIRHHLRHWLWSERGTVLMVGYQAVGTLGRLLQDGAKAVRIQGEEIRVRATIRKLDEYSGHADGAELTRWIAARAPIARGLFLVHGEEAGLNGMKERVSDNLIEPGKIFMPAIDDIFDLAATAPRRLNAHKPRIEREALSHLDWHNDMSEFLLDLNETLAKAASDKSRGVVLRRLQKALRENGA